MVVSELARRVTKLEVGGLMVVDVRCAFPDLAAPCPATGGLWPVQRFRELADLRGVVVHHDGVHFEAGDKDYDGTTLDEDLERLNAIYQQGLKQGWGGMPYHLIASLNQGAVYLCRDVRTFGAHVEAANHLWVGVAGMGDFSDVAPSPALLCGYGKAIAVAGILTNRQLTYVGHRELMATRCPGETWPSWKVAVGLMADFHLRTAV